MATEQAILHSENGGIRRQTGVSKFHDAGYYGERVRMGTGESWDINNFNPDDLVEIPFGNGPGWGNFSGGHGTKTAATFFQVAPKSKLYQLPKITSARTGKNCYCGFEDYCLEVIEKYNLLGVFCSFDQICDKYLAAKYTTILNQLKTFKYVVSAGNEYGSDYNELMECESVFGIGACYLYGTKFKPEAFTSRCEYVDFSAPDRQTVKFAANEDSVIEYGKESGTSFSGPWFLGQVALLDDYFIDKTGRPLEYKAVFDFVMDNIKDIDAEGFDETTGHGVFILPEPESIVLENYQDQTVDTPLTPPEEEEEPTIIYPAIFRVTSSNLSFYEQGSYICASGESYPFVVVTGPAYKKDGYWVATMDGLDSIIHKDCLTYVCQYAGEFIPKEDWPMPEIPDMSKYASFTHERYSAGVTVDVIPHDSIKKLDFAKCNEPKETVQSLYNHLDEKPQIVINGGLFNMSNGTNILSFVDETIEQNYQNNFEGMGIKTTDVTRLVKGVDKDGGWKDFMSAYPMLVREGKAVSTYDKGTELNYNAARQAIGYKEDGSIIIVTVDKVGAMKFEELADIFVKYGAYYAMNLDGGGSVYKMIGGEVANDPTENRAIDNVFMVYLNEEPAEEIVFPAIFNVVVNSQLRVRSGPSTDSETIGYLKNGRRIIVYSIEDGWAKMSTNIDLSDGEDSIEGYCSTDWIGYEEQYVEDPGETPEEPTDPDPEVPEEKPDAPADGSGIYRMTSAIQLRVRKEPDSSADTIGYIQPDALVTVYEIVGDWAKIEFEFNDTENDVYQNYGYCMAQYLEFVKEIEGITPEEPDEPTPDPEPEEPETPDKPEVEEPDIPKTHVYQIITDKETIPVYDMHTGEEIGYVSAGEEVIVLHQYTDEAAGETAWIIMENDDEAGTYVTGIIRMNDGFTLENDPDHVTIGMDILLDYPTEIYVVDSAIASAYAISESGDKIKVEEFPMGTILHRVSEMDIIETPDCDMICLSNNIADGAELWLDVNDVLQIGSMYDFEPAMRESEVPGVFVAVGVPSDIEEIYSILEGDLLYVSERNGSQYVVTATVEMDPSTGTITYTDFEEPIEFNAENLLFIASGERPSKTDKPIDIDLIEPSLYKVTNENGAILSNGKVLPVGTIFSTNITSTVYGIGRILVIDVIQMDNIEDADVSDIVDQCINLNDCEFVRYLKDVPDVSDTYEDLNMLFGEDLEAAKKMIDLGIMIGDGTQFMPFSKVDRTTLATVIHRLLKYLEENK